jgi:hypothetical protein
MSPLKQRRAGRRRDQHSRTTRHRGGEGGWYGAPEATNNMNSRWRSLYTSFRYKAGAYGTGTGTGTGTDTGTGTGTYVLECTYVLNLVGTSS